MSQSILQDKRECYVTGMTAPLEKHHILRGKNRNLAEKYGCWVWLIPYYHTASNQGVHGSNGKELDMKLKRDCQRKFEEIYSHELWMTIFGVNYL